MNVSDAFVDNVLVFGRLLRSAGLDVHLGRVLDAVTALSDVDMSVRDDVRHTLRALLVHRQEQLATFDRAFDLFWRAHALGDARQPGARSELHDLRRDSSAADAEESPSRWMAVPVEASPDTIADGREVGLWSDTGGLAHKDFAQFTEQENGAGARHAGAPRLDAGAATHETMGAGTRAPDRSQTCALAQPADRGRGRVAATPAAAHSSARPRAAV